MKVFFLLLLSFNAHAALVCKRPLAGRVLTYEISFPTKKTAVVLLSSGTYQTQFSLSRVMVYPGGRMVTIQNPFTKGDEIVVAPDAGGMEVHLKDGEEVCRPI